MIETFPDTTAERICAVDTYYRKEVLSPDGRFICSSQAACSAGCGPDSGLSFFPAQGVAIGPNYDTQDSGVPFRVMIVPMEHGRADTHLDLPTRWDQVAVRKSQPRSEWNPHMKGVAYALQLAFGLPLGDSPESLLIPAQPNPVHILDAYAMANITLCSRVTKGTTESAANSTIRRNCMRHLRAQIDILKPTLIITQGASNYKPMAATFTLIERHSPDVAVWSSKGHRFAWAQLHHPTRNWSSIKMPYFTKTVAPAITLARSVALAKYTDHSLSQRTP